MWWLCRYGHSWNAKICERTHEDKTCSVCESEFDSLLVQLMVSLYAKQYNMRVVTFDDNIIGLPVETYIPDMFSVIERINKRWGNENERAVKEHLCKMNGISYYEVSANNHYELADKIKKIFQKKNIYILSNSQEDIEKCKKAFFKWKDITQQLHHLIFSDFWCIMLLCQIKEMRFFSGQFNVSGYTLHQKLHQHTHYRILDNSRYDLVCVVLFL